MEDPKIFNIITFCKIFLKKMEEEDERSKIFLKYESIRMK